MPAVAAVTLVAGFGAQLEIRAVRAAGEAARVARVGDRGVGYHEFALYNCLQELLVNDTLTDAERGAIEVYVAVRYRERLRQETPLLDSRLEPVAEALRAKYTNPTDDQLIAAVDVLGRNRIDELDRPYRVR